jgi:hypothetical protein
MAAALFECCNRTFTADELLRHVEHRTNRCHWTYELVAAMLDAQTSHPSSRDGSRISTTVLTNKCLRRVAFERHHDYTTSLDDLWAMFRGTQFHGQLEAFAGPGTYAEARFHVRDLGEKLPEVAEALPDDNRSFSGSPDLVSVEAGILYDYKRTKEVPRWDRVWPDHVAQLNINRWLVDNADYVELEIDAEVTARFIDGEIEYDRTSRRGVYDLAHPDVRRYFVPYDWQLLTIVYVDDKGPKPINVTESITVPAKNGGTKRARVPEIWSDDKVEAYIADNYVTARRALNEGIAPIPSGWEYQSHALCVRCPMRRRCAEAEQMERDIAREMRALDESER